MKLEQLALTTYTIRDHIKTPKDVAASMKKLREIGFTAVQVSTMGPIEEGELRRILDGEGLTLCATHEPSQELLDDPAVAIGRLKRLGCTYTAYPHPGEVDLGDGDVVEKWIADLDKAARALADAGLVLTYHNHANEFRTVEGKTILEKIYDQTILDAEIDTYWVQAGGASPVEWCKKLNGRLPLLHLKDMGVDEENAGCMREIGYGNLGWSAIIKAADASGCKWFIVEQDTNFVQDDPFASLKMSYDYIATNLVE